MRVQKTEQCSSRLSLPPPTHTQMEELVSAITDEELERRKNESGNEARNDARSLQVNPKEWQRKSSGFSFVTKKNRFK